MSVNLTGGHAAMDYPEHARTYSAFLLGSKLLILFVAALLLGMAVFLTG